MENITRWKLVDNDGRQRISSKRDFDHKYTDFGTATELSITDTVLTIYQIALTCGVNTLYRTIVCFGGNPPDCKHPMFGQITGELNQELFDEFSKLYPNKTGSYSNVTTHQKNKYKLKNTIYTHEIDFYQRKTILLWMNQIGHLYFRRKIIGTGRFLEYNRPTTVEQCEVGQILWFFDINAKNLIGFIKTMGHILPQYAIYGRIEQRRYYEHLVEYHKYVNSFFWIPKQLMSVEIQEKMLLNLTVSCLYWSVYHCPTKEQKDISRIPPEIWYKIIESIPPRLMKTSLIEVIRMFRLTRQYVIFFSNSIVEGQKPVVFFQKEEQVLKEGLNCVNRDGHNFDNKKDINTIVRQQKRLILVKESNS